MLVFRNISIVPMALGMGGATLLVATGWAGLSLGALSLSGLLFAQLIVISGRSMWREGLVPVISFGVCVSGVAALSLLVETVWLRVGMAALVTVAHVVVFQQLFLYLRVPTRYQPNSLQHVSRNLAIGGLFCWTAFGFGLVAFVQTPFWVLLPGFVICAAILVWQFLWMMHVSALLSRKLVLIGTGFLVQAFITGYFLPVSFYVIAGMVAVAGYILFSGLSHLSSDTERKIPLRQSAIFASILMAVLAVTAAWR